MIKADIVKEVGRRLQIKDGEALVVVDGVLDSLKEVICEYRRLEIRDFGVFQVKTRRERVGRNPRDKVEYPIPARQVVTFRIGKELRNELEVSGRFADPVGPDQDELDAASGKPGAGSAVGGGSASPA
ncbi:MAG TPA: HU family DNA-binding protein [Sumerlaeia bacterium]|nr:HU family DNA-binding protein [Sumerlaeia bacterium]